MTESEQGNAVKPIGEILSDARQGANEPAPSNDAQSVQDRPDAAGPDEHRLTEWSKKAIYSERKKRQHLQQRVQELELEIEAERSARTRPETTQTDFYANPQAALRDTEIRMASRVALSEARSEYGAEALGDLNKIVGQAIERGHPDMPVLAARMQEAMLAGENPIGIAAEWARETAGWGKAKSPHYGMTFPSGLSGERSVGSRSGPAWNGPPSLNDIFKR